MSQETMGRDELDRMIKAVLEWAADEGEDRGFDPEFIESLQAQLEERGRLSERQIEALETIIDQWGITT